MRKHDFASDISGRLTPLCSSSSSVSSTTVSIDWKKVEEVSSDSPREPRSKESCLSRTATATITPAKKINREEITMKTKSKRWRLLKTVRNHRNVLVARRCSMRLESI